MQPDSLSPQEEKQPEPLPTQGTAQPETLSTQDVIQPESHSIQETKAPKRNLTIIILGIFLIILLMAVAGLGYWAYTLNTKLTATQQQLTALQGEHEKLQSDYAALTSDKEKLTTDLTQTKADLEKANADLITTRADFRKSQDKNKDLNAQIDKAGKLAEILYVWTTSDEASDILKINTLVEESNNSELKAEWKKLFASEPSQEALNGFILYLVTAIRNSLK